MSEKNNLQKPDTSNQLEGRDPAVAPDYLDRETAIAATLEQNGLKVSAKSRAVAAFDRLLGNIIDLPSAFVEPIIEKRRDENILTREIRKIKHEREISRFARDGDDPYIERLRREQVRKDKNRIEIGMIAIDDLISLPPVQGEADIRTIDPDWLNEFVEIASRKSCDDMQLLWGRLLAGEIRKPGAFKLRTLQRLSAVDSSDARSIHDFLLHAVGNQFVVRDDSNNTSAINFSRALEMEDIGILTVSGGMLYSEIKLEENESHTFILCGDLVKVTAKKKTMLSVPSFPLTSFGKELAALIVHEPTPIGYIELLAKCADRELFVVETARILKIENREMKTADWTVLV